MGDLTPHFNRSEFACKCGCGYSDIDINLVLDLERLRAKVGPISISSGCRCEKHNRKVGGSRNSSHVIGKAVDVAVPNSGARYRYLQAVFSEPIPLFARIEICKGWLHFDINQSLPQEVVFLQSEA